MSESPLHRFLSWLRLIFRGGDWSRFPPATRRRKKVDVEELKRRLRIEERAKENASRELPPSSTSTPDNVEQEIIETFEGERKEQVDDFLGELKVRQNQLNGLACADLLPRISGVGDEIHARYEALKRRRVEDLHRLKRDFFECAAELRAFREKHRLQRPPVYPESRLWHWGILALILLVEAFVNGVFLARGHEEGLLGGISFAIGFALINIFLGWTNGRLLVPRFHHARVIHRLVGLLGATLLFSLTVGFNLVVAKYREAVGTMPEYPGREALTLLLQDPLAFSDVESLMLFVTGLVFALIAAADGYKWDDPYPAYGRWDRRLREREQDYISETDAAYQEIEDLRAEAFAELRSLGEEIARRRVRHQDIAQMIDMETKHFEQHVQYLERTCEQLLSTYRSVNRASRSTPEPAYFKQPWRYNADDNIDLRVATSQVRRSDPHADEAAARIEEVRRTVVAEQSSALAVFEQVGELEKAS